MTIIFFLTQGKNGFITILWDNLLKSKHIRKPFPFGMGGRKGCVSHENFLGRKKGSQRKKSDVFHIIAGKPEPLT